VDTTAAVGERALSDCVDRLAEHGAVDAVVVALVPTALAAATGDDPQRALTHADPGRRSRTVAAVLPDQAEQVRLLHGRDGASVPSYADPQAAARALAHAAERARWLARPVGTVPGLRGTDPAGARALAGRFLTDHPEGGWLDPLSCTELLSQYGIAQLPTAFAVTEDQAVETVRDLTDGDERAAMKAYWPGLLHKSEQDAVLLDLDGEDAVRAAHRELSSRFGDVMTGVVVQPMARRGTELVAGVVHDDVFGPLVLFGLGGTATDVLADHAARLAPLTDRDVHDLLTAPRCAPLLFGHHGGKRSEMGVPPAGGWGTVDLDGLEQLLLRLSALACDLPQLAEADLNPVVARPDGVLAVDVRIRVMPRHPHDPYLRRLRRAAA
jgi:acyl-CoA synthetase (NDP forming)